MEERMCTVPDMTKHRRWLLLNTWMLAPPTTKHGMDEGYFIPATLRLDVSSLLASAAVATEASSSTDNQPLTHKTTERTEAVTWKGGSALP